MMSRGLGRTYRGRIGENGRKWRGKETGVMMMIMRSRGRTRGGRRAKTCARKIGRRRREEKIEGNNEEEENGVEDERQ